MILLTAFFSWGGTPPILYPFRVPADPLRTGLSAIGLQLSVGLPAVLLATAALRPGGARRAPPASSAVACALGLLAVVAYLGAFAAEQRWGLAPWRLFELWHPLCYWPEGLVRSLLACSLLAPFAAAAGWLAAAGSAARPGLAGLSALLSAHACLALACAWTPYLGSNMAVVGLGLIALRGALVVAERCSSPGGRVAGALWGLWLVGLTFARFNAFGAALARVIG